MLKVAMLQRLERFNIAEIHRFSTDCVEKLLTASSMLSPQRNVGPIQAILSVPCGLRVQNPFNAEPSENFAEKVENRHIPSFISIISESSSNAFGRTGRARAAPSISPT